MCLRKPSDPDLSLLVSELRQIPSVFKTSRSWYMTAPQMMKTSALWKQSLLKLTLAQLRLLDVRLKVRDIDCSGVNKDGSHSSSICMLTHQEEAQFEKD